MKRPLIAAILAALCFVVQGAESRTSPRLMTCPPLSPHPVSDAKEPKNPIQAPDTVVWAGLDYSKVRMIGTNDFRVPDTIFPGMLEKWNALFIDERIEKVADALGKRVAIDIGGVTERNKTATADQIILTPGPKDVIEESHITPKDIADEVQSYKMEKTNGLGLVFIVDRLIDRPRYLPTSVANQSYVGQSGRTAPQSIAARGAVYIVFFDVSSRAIISSQREIHTVSSGSNFRNFWFGVIKDTDSTLRKYR